MSESKPFFHKETKDGYRECPDPRSVCGWGPQDRCYLTTTDNQGNNVKIMSPVSATIASIEIKEQDYRNRTAVFITIHFDDGSVLLGFFIKSGEYREDHEKCYKYFTQYDYLNYSENNVFHLKPEEGKTIDFFEVVSHNSYCFYEEYCWIIVSGGVVSLLKVDEDTLLNIFFSPMSYHPNRNIFSISELDFSERLEGLGEVVGSCRIDADGRPVKISCDFQIESGEIVLTVELKIFEANYEREQDGQIDGVSTPEYREAELREVGV
jgi:hypothetical protein